MFLLRVEGTRDRIYWLDLEVSPDATLGHLDLFLREVWLECCGHLSGFFDGGGELEMSSRVRGAFPAVGQRLGYEYDFGSTTGLTLLRRASERGQRGGTEKVRLLARNDPPRWPCTDCDEPATVICSYCSWEGGGFYCEDHAREHDCEDEAFLPVVNSPRMGVCGYSR
jgi:hypothetical protein